MTTFGVDVSSIVGASQLKVDGAAFVVSRAVTELGTVDSACAANAKAALATGIIPGGYHWLVEGATRSPAAQAQQFYSVVAPFLGGPFLAQLDVERDAYHQPTFADVLGFYDEWRKLTDHPLLPYGNRPDWTDPAFGLPADAASRIGITSFWLAAYPLRFASAPNVSTNYPGDGASAWGTKFGGFSVVLWQFAGTVDVGGYSVDLDAFRGTSLATLTGAPMPTFAVLDNTPGTVTVKGAGHAIIKVADWSIRGPLTDGQTFSVAAKIHWDTPLDSHTGDRQTGFLAVGRAGLSAEWVLASDVTFTAAQPPVTVTHLTATYSDGHTAVLTI